MFALCAAGACVLLVSHLVLFIAPSESTVWLANICTGLAYGMCICGLNQILSIFFGLSKFGFNHGILNTAGALGAVFFTVICSVIVNVRDLKSDQCTGDKRLECYRFPFLFSACFLTVGVFFSVLLMTRYPPKFLLYRTVPQNEHHIPPVPDKDMQPPFVTAKAE